MINNVLPQRPESPELGDVWEQPIDEILNEWFSVDGATPGDWHKMLEGKRRDNQYYDVVASIRDNGFIRPLTMYTEDKYGYDERGIWGLVEEQPEDKERYFGDGHHRLAAAIDLGYVSVPIKYREGSMITRDSGGWRAGNPIRTDEEEEARSADPWAVTSDGWGEDYAEEYRCECGCMDTE